MILLTGATGFVGDFLSLYLNDLNISFNAAIRSPASSKSFKNSFLVDDINELTDWSPVLAGIETIVHLAARVHVMRETNPDPMSEFRSANVDATINLALQAAQAGVKRFVFLSTIKVNGESTHQEQ
jgi:nucleoside-diphosphate-sugar epimerase